MNHTYILPLLISTIVHGAVLYSFSAQIEEPEVFVPQAVTALEICIEGSVSEDQSIPVAPEVEEVEPVEEALICEERSLVEQEVVSEVCDRVTEDTRFVEKVAQVKTQVKPDVSEPELVPQKKNDANVSPRQQGNSDITHAGAVGSDNGFSEPELIYNPTPKYPRKARRRGDEGMVVVSVMISAEGRVITADVTIPSGSSLLDAAALTTVKKWRFIPAKKRGEVISAQRAIPFVFKLK